MQREKIIDRKMQNSLKNRKKERQKGEIFSCNKYSV